MEGVYRGEKPLEGRQIRDARKQIKTVRSISKHNQHIRLSKDRRDKHQPRCRRPRTTKKIPFARLLRNVRDPSLKRSRARVGVNSRSAAYIDWSSCQSIYGPSPPSPRVIGPLRYAITRVRVRGGPSIISWEGARPSALNDYKYVAVTAVTLCRVSTPAHTRRRRRTCCCELFTDSPTALCRHLSSIP